MSIDLAWAAGIFDGEGCLSINRQRASSRKDLVNDTYRMVAKVTMGHLPTITRFHEIVGVGTVHSHVPHGKTVNSSYSWVAQSQMAKEVTELLEPFLLTKKEEARLAMKFFSLPTGTTGGKGGNSPKPEHLIEAQLTCYWQLRMAKSRWRFYREKLSDQDVSELIRLGLE